MGLKERSALGQPDMEEEPQDQGKTDYPTESTNLGVLDANGSKSSVVT